MPRIFDNIESSLLPALSETLKVSQRADFCVGYFNLRGWRQIDRFVDDWTGADDSRCRLLVGMQRLPQEALRSSLSLLEHDRRVDSREARRLKLEAALEFRQQLAAGAPSNDDEAGLQRLKAQIQAGKLAVKLFLRYPLHAKLYLLHRQDPNNPTTGYLGSSNLTLAGLRQQGELNVDVLDHDACNKLQEWFEDRWSDRLCVDISDELVEIIDESWAREELIPPYHIYLKMAYHLSRDAREGVAEFRIPPIFGNQLFEFQAAAAQIAAHHINRRGGALIGDVVGLGKTLMATAVAKILEDDYGLETLIICPKNLTEMWKDYAHRYQLRHEVMSISVARNRLPDLRRYRIVIVDESHNLRNPEGQTYRAIREYIAANESRCVLLSATPYNKSYTDLSAQLGLFTPVDKDLGVRPERQLRGMAKPSSFASISAASAPWPPLSTANSPTTGANSCGSTWSGGLAASLRTTTRSLTRTTVASISSSPTRPVPTSPIESPAPSDSTLTRTTPTINTPACIRIKSLPSSTGSSCPAMASETTSIFSLKARLPRPRRSESTI